MAEGAGEQHGQPIEDDFGLNALREVLRLISENPDTGPDALTDGGAALLLSHGCRGFLVLGFEF